MPKKNLKILTSDSSDFTQVKQIEAEKRTADEKKQRSDSMFYQNITEESFWKMLYMYILQLTFNFIQADFVKESMAKKLASLLADYSALREYVKYRKLLR